MTKLAPYVGEAVVKRGLAKLGKTHTPGMCQREIRLLFNVPSVGDHDRDGDADAHDAWKSAVAKGKVVKDRKVANAPRGAYLYFSGGTHGHVALGLGGDDCVSTDAAGRGVWGRSKISALEKRWNRQYEGYIVITGNDYRVFQEAPKGQTTPRTRFEVTATRLNARRGPGTNYASAKVRDKGFQFNSTKRHGKWRQASTYWYHEDYLKTVSQDAPTTVRYEVTASRLNARSGPGMGYSVKTTRDKGFQFNSSNASGDWVQASTYWYHKKYLKVVSAPKITRYEVTATRLNGRSGPGMKHPVKVVRDKGFQFNSSVAEGDWIRASTYWYHKDYLKVAGSPTPEPSPQLVNIRIGSLNIPLDADKLPDGAQRAKEAAKQINASNLAAIGVQELDRWPNAKSHKYAEQLLRELGSDWIMSKPSTNWNENYLFIRKDSVIFKQSLPDKILTSKAGGRHATRAKVEKDGKELTLISTHFVSGSGNGSSREEQGTQLAEISDAQTIILGDLNQKAVPKALAKMFKTARDNAQAATNAEWGTFAKWGNTQVGKSAGAFLDHVLLPLHAIVKGYTVVGVSEDGKLDQPRISDHLLIIVSVDL